MPSGPRTVPGLVAFALTMALIIVTLLYPPIGVVAVAALVGAGWALHRWLPPGSSDRYTVSTLRAPTPTDAGNE